MTEHEWLTSSDPQAMLDYLLRRNEIGTISSEKNLERRGISDRKLRLFACACCRQVWDGELCPRCKGEKRIRVGSRMASGPIYHACTDCHSTGRIGGITDPRSRRSVEVAEQFADGKAMEEELATAYEVASEAHDDSAEDNTDAPLYDAWACCDPIASECARMVTNQPYSIPPAAQADLLRCIFGNPYHPVIIPHHRYQAESYGEWQPQAWFTPTVCAIAQTIYDECRFEDIPILADALEEAECPKEVECPACFGHGLNTPEGSGRCPTCHGTGRIPNTILAHLRQTERVCPECGGTKKVKIDDNPPYRERWIRCDVYHREVGWAHLGCDGTGRLPAVHARGCWVLDLILGKEGCL